MDTEILKNAIKDDLEMLKILEVGIMPSAQYYRLNFKWYGRTFLGLYFILLSALMVSFLLHLLFFSNDDLGFPLFMVGAISSLIVSGFLFIFLQGTINSYLIFYYQIKPHLKTGDFLVENIRKVTIIAITIFCILVVIPTLIMPYIVAIAGFVAFLITGLLISMLIQMEINRIGIATLFLVLKQVFEKLKTGGEPTMK